MPFLPTAQWTKVVDAQKKSCMCRSNLLNVVGFRSRFTVYHGDCLLLGAYVDNTYLLNELKRAGGKRNCSWWADITALERIFNRPPPADIPKPVTEEAPAVEGSAEAARRKSVFPLAGTTSQGLGGGGDEYDQLFAYNFDDPVSLDDVGGDRSTAKKVTLDDIVGWLQEVKVPGISPYEQVCGL